MGFGGLGMHFPVAGSSDEMLEGKVGSKTGGRPEGQ